MTAGTSRWARESRSAIRRRTAESGSRRPPVAALGVPPPAARRTSSSVIRPPGPVAVSEARSTPSSWASRRTSGVAWTGAEGVGGVGGGSTTPSPMTTSAVPTGTTLPASTRMWLTGPATGEGISTVVLSVSISTSGSSSATSWPTSTSQRAISPSATPSPRSGRRNV